MNMKKIIFLLFLVLLLVTAQVSAERFLLDDTSGRDLYGFNNLTNVSAIRFCDAYGTCFTNLSILNQSSSFNYSQYLDQYLNTTSSPTFVNVTTTGYYNGDGSQLTGSTAIDIDLASNITNLNASLIAEYLRNDGDSATGAYSINNGSLDIHNTSGAQLRLSNIFGINYTDFQTNSLGFLNISPSGNQVNIDGNVYPTSDNTYQLGEAQSKEWSGVYTRQVAGNNRRFLLKTNGNMAELHDHQTIGTGVQILHRNTVVAQFGNGTGAPFLGVATSTPSDPLTVVTTGNDKGFRLVNNITGNPIFKVTRDGASDQAELFLYKPSGIIQFAIRPGNPGYINTGQNFGIGTTSPNASLHVYGSTNIGAVGSNAGDGDLNIADQLRVGINDATYLYLDEDSINGQEDIGIQENAFNLGIGTSSPQAKLDVNGATQIIDSTVPLLLGYNQTRNTSFSMDSSGNLYVQPSGGSSQVTNTLRINGATQAGRGLVIRSTSDSLLNLYYNSLYGAMIKAPEGGTQAINIELTTATALDRSFNVRNSNGDNYFKVGGNGLVGINSTNPQGTLDVNGTICIYGDCIASWDDVNITTGGGSQWVINESQLANQSDILGVNTTFLDGFVDAYGFIPAGTSDAWNIAGENITSGTVDESYIDSAIAREASLVVANTTANTALTGLNGKLDQVINDTTPQLGGVLDTNDNNINLANNTLLNFTGADNVCIFFNGTAIIINNNAAGVVCP